MRVGNGVDTTSHATMKMTVNVRSQRKRAQVENFASLLSAADPEPGTVVVDFGCGSGNLVLPLAHLFPALRFVGVDLKPKATELLQQRAAEANLTNVCCETTPIEAYHGPCDIALSLHACGPASDQVLCAALQHGAAFLISPCCVGKITPQSSVASLARNFRRVDQQLPGVNAPHRTRTISRRLTAANIDAKTFELLCQTADRSEGLAPDSMPSSALTPPICLPSRVADPTQAHFLRGRLCKSAVELDRVSWVWPNCPKQKRALRNAQTHADTRRMLSALNPEPLTKPSSLKPQSLHPLNTDTRRMQSAVVDLGTCERGAWTDIFMCADAGEAAGRQI